MKSSTLWPFATVAARTGDTWSRFKCAVVALLATLGSGLATADYWNGPTNYLHKRNGMLDFDQQRADPPACALPPFPAIPIPSSCGFIFPGGMHCGPASGVNLYVFMANHGYPALLPAAQLGDIWRQPAWFCQGTAHIFTLGQWSGWSLNGTSTQGMAFGLQKAVNLAKQPITAGHYMATGKYGLNLNQLASAGLNGAIVMVAYGHYQVVAFMGNGVPVVQRKGGHFVVMTSAYRNDPICKLRIRDPADDGCAPVLPTQAAYKDHVYNAVDGWVRVSQPPFGANYRWMTRIYPEASAPGFGIGSTLSLLDGFTYCIPRKAIGKPFTPLAGGSSEFVIFGPSEPWSTDSEFTCEPIDLGATIIDVALHPEGSGLIAILESSGIAGAAMRSVVAVDDATNQTTTLAEIATASALLVGRKRDVYVTSEGMLHRLQLPDGAEQPRPGGGDEDAGDPVTELPLPFALDTIDYDDFGDNVVGLSVDNAAIAVAAYDFARAVDTYTIPSRVVLADGASLAVNPTDGNIWVASSSSSTISALAVMTDKSGGSTLSVVDEIMVPVPDGQTIADVDFVDPDDIIVITPAGDRFEFVRDLETGPEWVKIDPTFELPCGISSHRPSRGRGNFNPGEHDDPDAFFDIDPGVVIPGVEEPDPLCLGDLTGDGLVDGADLAVLLSGWGESFGASADFNADGLTNGHDLAIVLGHWGPCPE